MSCRFYYELLVAKGLTLNDDVDVAQKHFVERPPHFIDTTHLSNQIATVTNFTVGVRIRLIEHNIKSMIDHFEHIEVYPMVSANYFSYYEIVGMIMCAIILIIALGILCYRFVIKPQHSKTICEETLMTTWRLGHNQSYENPITDQITNTRSEYTNSVHNLNDVEPLIEPEPYMNAKRLSATDTRNNKVNNK